MQNGGRFSVAGQELGLNYVLFGLLNTIEHSLYYCTARIPGEAHKNAEQNTTLALASLPVQRFYSILK